MWMHCDLKVTKVELDMRKFFQSNNTKKNNTYIKEDFFNEKTFEKNVSERPKLSASYEGKVDKSEFHPAE